MTMIILLRADDLSIAALWYDQESGESGTDTPLEALATKVHADAKKSVCIAVPGEFAVSRMLSLPMKQDRDARRAADLLIDDMLASPLEERVVAIGERTDDGRLTSAVEADLLLGVLDVATAAGIDPDILTTDHALLPDADGASVAALRIGGRVAMRTPEGAFSSEAGFAQSLFQGRESEPLRQIQVEQLSSDGAPNFRSGRFAKRRPLPNLRPFAMAASLVLIAGAVFLASSLIEGVRYSGGASAMRQEAEANFRRAFPGTPIVDMERQLAGQVSATEGSDFLPLAAALAELVAEQEQTTLTGLTYAASGELAAELTVVSIPDLEALSGALRERGVDVEEGGDVRREEGALTARLFLRAL